MHNTLWRTVAIDVAIILGISLLISLPLWLLGGDAALAHWAHTPDAPWAWWLRQYAQVPLSVASLLALIFLLIPPLRRRWPTLRQLAGVWLATLLIGGGLLNQVIIQDLVDRPRPRESVLLTELSSEGAASLSGNSFPSGHAVIGFMLAVPFFIYRRTRPRLAWGLLAAGLLAGFGIGYARMALGAHFLTDVIWAGTILLVSATIFTRLLPPTRDVPTGLTASLLGLGVAAIVWFNHFTVTLTHVVQNPRGAQISLPCATFNFPNAPQGSTVTVAVKAYGAPVSNLLLQEEKGLIQLSRWRGIYHSITCQVTLETAPLATTP